MITTNKNEKNEKKYKEKINKKEKPLKKKFGKYVSLSEEEYEQF